MHSTIARKLSLLASQMLQLHHLLPKGPLARNALSQTDVWNCSQQWNHCAGFLSRPFILHLTYTRPSPLYADDTYLIVPASDGSTVSAELEHISSWALVNNNLRHNTNKFIHRRSGFKPPQSIKVFECVKTVKILGVMLSKDLNAATHIFGVL